MNAVRKGAVAGILGAVVLTGSLTLGVFATASGQSPERTILKLDGKLSSYHASDLKPKKDSAGDSFQFTDKITGDKTGTDAGTCVHANKKYEECTWTINVPGGSFQMAGIAVGSNAPYTIAIVGGTGDFFGARGQMTVTDALKSVAHYELSYLLP